MIGKLAKRINSALEKPYVVKGWLIAISLLVAFIIGGLALSVTSVYDIDMEIKSAWAVGKDGVTYYATAGRYAWTPWEPWVPRPDGSSSGGLGGGATISDGKAGDVPNVGINLQVPHDPSGPEETVLHGADGDYKVYVWTLEVSLAITASPAVEDHGWGSWSYDEWADVTVRVGIASRLNYSLIYAYCDNITLFGTSPGDLAAQRNLWFWTARYDYHDSTAYYPLVNGAVRNLEKVEYVKDAKRALEAFDLRRGITLEFKARIVPTVVQKTDPWWDVYAAPATLVWSFKIIVARAFKVTPTQPQGMEPISNPTINVESKEAVPWWAWWSLAVLVLIGVIIVLVKSIPAAVARAAKSLRS